MMPMCKYLVPAVVAVVMASSAVSAQQEKTGSVTLGLPMGTPLEELAVDFDDTRARGLGTDEAPQVSVSRVPNGSDLWARYEVLAAPETGVCGVGGYSSRRETNGAAIEVLLADVFDSRLLPLMEQVGAFAWQRGDTLDTTGNLTALSDMLRSQGRVEFISAAENVPEGRYGQFVVMLEDEVISEEYTVLYDNFPLCMEEIYAE